MQRGEVWWVDFDERRPVVLLSDGESSGFQAMQVVAPAGVDIDGLGVEVAVGPWKECPSKACCGSRSRVQALLLAHG